MKKEIVVLSCLICCLVACVFACNICCAFSKEYISHKMIQNITLASDLLDAKHCFIKNVGASESNGVKPVVCLTRAGAYVYVDYNLTNLGYAKFIVIFDVYRHVHGSDVFVARGARIVVYNLLEDVIRVKTIVHSSGSSDTVSKIFKYKVHKSYSTPTQINIVIDCKG